jgi:hypothetical protein
MLNIYIVAKRNNIKNHYILIFILLYKIYFFGVYFFKNLNTNKNFQLGEVVITVIDADNSFVDIGNPIGVVIQLHDDGDCRTDMFGNCSSSEVRLATLDEIKEYRENLINDLEV